MGVSPRNAARFCWVMTILGFIIGAIGMATGYMYLFYIGLIMLCLLYTSGFVSL